MQQRNEFEIGFRKRIFPYVFKTHPPVIDGAVQYDLASGTVAAEHVHGDPEMGVSMLDRGQKTPDFDRQTRFLEKDSPPRECRTNMQAGSGG